MLKDHQASAVHQTLLQLVVEKVRKTYVPYSYDDVSEMLSSECAQEKRFKRQCLLKILSNVAS